MSLSPRPGIMEMAPYVPGASKVDGVKRIIKLSSNEGALGPSPAAIVAYESLGPDLHRYPDGGSADLRTAIGARNGLDPDRIVCGAGSDELLALLARAYAGPGDEVLFGEHAFVMYPLFALSVGATPVKAPEVDFTVTPDAILSKVTERTRIVYVANPNNPTGTMITSDEMVRLRAGLRDDILLVIDAAYAEYVTRNDYSPGVELVDEGDNVVMTRTFSKIYAMGGARLGWAYCQNSVVEVLNRIRPPFNVTSGAQAAGIAAINDVEFLTRSRDHNTTWLPWLSDQLQGMGLDVVPSAGNFLLVRFPESGAQTADKAMAFLASQGIIPRSTRSAGIPEGIRITIGLEQEMRTTADAISDFLEIS
ncbi:MAG: Histidinol-phosphate aminotransferase [Alphaproteobacteria bacterium MarineAlpha11_Bin1]|nr:MAG: Histidinol-phosphate aminotransferase [Alphaproteobacteria bacterium MarineAlpha11_Bin1]